MTSEHSLESDIYWSSPFLSAILQQIVKYIKTFFQLHITLVQLTIAYQQLPVTSDNAKFYEGSIPDKPVM